VAAPVLATCLLAAAVHAFVASPTLVGDAVGYDRAARALAGHGDLGWAMTFLAARGYLYPALLALVYAVGGNAETAGWIQALVLLPLTTFLIYAAGREAFSRKVGLVAAWAFAMWLPAAWHTRLLLAETLLAMLMAALALLLAATLVRNRVLFAACAGFVAATISIAHSAYQVLPFVLVAAVLLATRSRRLTVGFTAGATVVLIPYLFVLAAGAPHLGSGAAGYGGAWGFYVGSRAETNFTNTPDDDVVAGLQYDLPRLKTLIDQGRVHVEPHLRAAISRRLADGQSELRETDYYRAGVENLLADPRGWPRKLGVNFSTLFVLQDDPKLGEQAVSPSIWLDRVWRPLSIALALLAVAGLASVLALRRAYLLLFAPALLQALFLMLPKVEPRYVVPLWPAMFLLLGVALLSLPLTSLFRPWRVRASVRSLD